MKERPILFSAPMVRALLDGRKTQTRRAVKPMPNGEWMPSVGFYCPTLVAKEGEEYPGTEVFGASDEVEGRKCPFGLPGDRLWVKETWRTTRGLDHCKPTGLVEGAPIEYLADGYAAPHGLQDKGKTRTPLFMRRWMSRIVVEIMAVRVERLQAISAADAFAEGVRIPCDANGRPLLRITGRVRPDVFSEKNPKAWGEGDFARFEYAELWESLSGPGSWGRNPWVWVLEFRRVEA